MQRNPPLPPLATIRRLWRMITHPWTQSFVAGILLALILFANWQDRYEDRLFQSLATKVQDTNLSPLPDDSLFVRALHLSHNMLAARSATFYAGKRSGWMEFIEPLSSDLMTAEGACGSYAVVLCRLLQKLNYSVRLAHMGNKGRQVCHIVVEVRSGNDWVVLDPLYDLYFRKPGGGLASFEEVSTAWPSYRSQTPPNYDQRYSYAGVLYTNWNKIPVLMPLLKDILRLSMDKNDLEHLSLRIFFLRKFRVMEYIFLIPFVFISLLFLRRFRPPQIFLNRYLNPSTSPKEV